MAEYQQVPTFETAEGPQQENGHKSNGDITARNSRFKRSHFTKRDCIIVGLTLALALAAIVVSLAFGIPALQAKKARYFNLTTDPSEMPLQMFEQSVVVTDADYCAEIGKEILSQGGTAVDASIAALFCNGAVNPHSMGLGGGVIFTVYDSVNKVSSVIDGRETAPEISQWAQEGGLSIAVPGELRAYQLVHSAYGKLPFRDLIKPTIKMCRVGFKVSSHFSEMLKSHRSKITKNMGMRDAFFNTETGKVYREGEIMKCEKLARTLETIFKGGVDEFYNGSLTDSIVEDITSAGGNMSKADLAGYQAKKRTPVRVHLKHSDTYVISAPPPASGSLLTLMLSVLDGYEYNKTWTDESQDIPAATLMYQRIAETFKFAFAAKSHLSDEDFLKNKTILAELTKQEFADSIRSRINGSVTFAPDYYDPHPVFSPEDKGTGQVSVYTPSLVVSATSSINSDFGSLVRSNVTGIIYNNHMADFNMPRGSESENGSAEVAPNDVEAGKRPMSSMSPSIFTDSHGQVTLVLGGVGGTRMLTGQTLIAFRHLYLGKDIKQAIDEPRIHHMLFPNELYVQPRFPGVLRDNLASFGHKARTEQTLSSFQAISAERDGEGKTVLKAMIEPSKGGSVAGT